jgi:hypothetical protein
MGKGKAIGINRDYQVLARKIVQLVSYSLDLGPFAGDGVDVSFDLGGTPWTIDFALKSVDESRIVLGECRRWASPIKQDDIAAFAYKVGLLRQKTGKQVAGMYFTKTRYQIGAIKAAAAPGIEVVRCRDNQSVDDFFVTYYTYDRAKRKQVRSHVSHRTTSFS